jgi:hypothetical protein
MRTAAPVIMREAAIAGVLATALTVLLADHGVPLRPHPAWAAVLLLAARYGSRGLGCALPAVSAALGLGSLCGLAVGDLATVSSSGADLGALVVSILVSWVASVHESRSAALVRKVAELDDRSASDNIAVPQLRAAAVALRARADRLGHSLSFLRGVSARLEGSDAVTGAQAALELAMERIGARGGVVQIGEKGNLRTIASSGLWNAAEPMPMAASAEASRHQAPGSEAENSERRDRTALAAFESGAPVRAIDLRVTGPGDSDMAVPVTSPTGDVVGVLALRGVPLDSLGAALLHDLALIAQWCAKPILARRFERRGALRIEDAIPLTPMRIAPREDAREPPLQIAADCADAPTSPPPRSN